MNKNNQYAVTITLTLTRKIYVEAKDKSDAATQIEYLWVETPYFEDEISLSDEWEYCEVNFDASDLRY